MDGTPRIGPRIIAAILTLLGTAASQTDWTRAPFPVDREGHGMAFDSERQRVVLFGGQQGRHVVHGDTMEWDGTAWQTRALPMSPPARGYHGLAYDPNRGRVILFGGSDAAGNPLADTWEYDGSTWIQRTPQTVPPARDEHGMAYDPVRGVVMMFGGHDGTNHLADHWEWDGVDWRLQALSTAPPARNAHTLATDDARRRVVLFGGYDASWRVLGDTWEWDGSKWSMASTSGPPARAGHAMTYDPASSRMLLFGGTPGLWNVTADVWTWNGTAWQKLLGVPAPPGRVFHRMASDPVRGVVVLFGGLSGSSLSDTWEWNGTGWSQAAGVTKPTGRNEAEWAYDAARGRAVLHGGGAVRGISIQTDTWEWDGDTWHRMAPATVPLHRSGAALTFDRARGVTLRAGGCCGLGGFETWTWDGADWRQRFPHVSPPERSGHAMAHDEARGVTVLFGGSDTSAFNVTNDTWEWDGVTWRQRSPSTPPPARQWHGMAYDSVRERVVLFGGALPPYPYTPFDDLWEWDGSEWTQCLSGGTAPPARYQHGMAFDRTRGQLVVFGGNFNAQRSPLGDTWEWDGAAWRARATATVPLPRFGMAMTYDEARRETVMFSGMNSTEFTGLWTYAPDSPATAQPFGSGCLGSNGVPRLAAAPGSLPWMGQAFVMDVSNLPPARFAIGMIGLSNTTWHGLLPLPFSLASIGAPGCQMLISDEVHVLLLTAGGSATWRLPVPVSPLALGVDFYTQTIAIDPPANPLGLTFSNGLAGTVGGL